MTYDQFVEQLRTTGSYQTPQEFRPRFLDRTLGWSDAWYYFRMYQITVSARKLANKGQFTTREWARHSFLTMQNVEACGGTATVHGAEHIRALSGPAVFVSNHMSMLETFLLGCILSPFRHTCIVVKQSLVDHKFFGVIMRSVEPIAVSRTDPREDFKKVLSIGQENLARGNSVLIFPQATRNPLFIPAEFNSMGAKLAAKANVPLLPIALRTDFQGIGGLLRDFGPITRSRPVRIQIGAPLNAKDNPREAHQQCRTFIAAHLREWGMEVKDSPSQTEE